MKINIFNQIKIIAITGILTLGMTTIGMASGQKAASYGNERASLVGAQSNPQSSYAPKELQDRIGLIEEERLQKQNRLRDIEDGSQYVHREKKLLDYGVIADPRIKENPRLRNSFDSQRENRAGAKVVEIERSKAGVADVRRMPMPKTPTTPKKNPKKFTAKGK